MDYTKVSLQDLSFGIDQRSAESAIEPGFAEDLVNVDTSSSGPLSKRKGYENYFGYLPLRVKEVRHVGSQIFLCFDESVSLLTQTSSPIVVFGKLGNPTSLLNSTDWTLNDQGIYYSSFSVEARYELPAGQTTSIDLTHNRNSSALLVGSSEATQNNTLDNSHVFSDEIRVQKTGDSARFSFNLNGATENAEVFVYVSEDLDGQNLGFQTEFVVGDWVGNEFTVPLNVHNLPNLNIIPQIFLDQGTYFEPVLADFTIKDNGDVVVSAGQPFNGKLVLADNNANFTSDLGVDAGQSTLTVTPPSGELFFTAVYLRDNLTGDRELVQPDQVVYDPAAQSLSFSFVTSSAVSVQLVYKEASLVSNCLILEDTTGNTANYVDEEPQMTVWGIPHENLYPVTSKGGRVNHIDSYRRELENRVIAGLGGNFFAAQTLAETSPEYLIPNTAVNLGARTNGAQDIGPFFVNTNDFSAKTDILRADNVEGNTVEVDSFIFDNGNVVLGLSRLINRSGTLNDLSLDLQITVTDASFAVMNGTFDVVEVDDINETITIFNPKITDSNFDEVGACARAGIFMDRIELNSNPFTVGDQVNNNLLDGIVNLEVWKLDGNNILVSGVTDEVEIPSALLLSGQRQGTVVPVVDVSNFVLGDNVQVGTQTNPAEIMSIDVTNRTIVLDNSYDVQNQITIEVLGRFIPVEAPTTNDSLPPKTQFRPYDAFAYANQSTVRSTMNSGNLYTTDGFNEVGKYDGTNFYRAGLPRWQPAVFIKAISDSQASIDTGTELAKTAAAVSAGQSEIPVTSTSNFTVNQAVVLNTTNGAQQYFINSIIGTDTIRINGTLQSDVGNDTEINERIQLDYYLRLSAVDKNQNIVASATVGSQDLRVDILEPSFVQIKIVGMPAYSRYDWDTINVEVFRADSDILLFRRVAEINLSFDRDEGYLLFTDTQGNKPSDRFDDLPLDNTVNNNVPNGELANGWDQPLRAKYITNVNGQTILANLRDYPELSLRLRSSVSINNNDFVGTKILLRRDSLDTGTVTDNVNRTNFEFVNSGQQSLLSVSDDNGFTQVETTFPDVLSPGDWVYLFHGSLQLTDQLTYSGWYQVKSVLTASTFTINAPFVSGADFPDNIVTATSSADVPVWVGQDGNHGSGPLAAFRTLSTTLFRLGQAVNVTQRITTESVGFRPWIIARSGSEFGLGSILFRQPNANPEAISVVLPDLGPSIEWLQNSLPVNTGINLASTERQFPSRIIASLPAPYNDVFDRPFDLEELSNFVFDISPSDGEEITGSLPFFSRSSFSDSQQESVTVVFKENSIHVLNTSTGQRQRLQTQGVGCSFPYSIARSKDSIMFAHQSGVYRLNKDLTVDYVGKFVERLWNQYRTKNDLSEIYATQYSLDRQYKLSVPSLTGSRNNDEVLVYDYDRETDQRVEYGAWTRYNNHPVTGWTNLENQSFFGSTKGLVFRLRNKGENTDYRDRSSAIRQEIVLGGLNFGMPGTQKIVKDVLIQYRVKGQTITGSKVFSSVDLNNIFDQLDEFVLNKQENQTGLGSTVSASIQTLNYSLPRKILEYLQVKLTNDFLDENMVVTGIIFSVGTRSSSTITDAGSTT